MGLVNRRPITSEAILQFDWQDLLQSDSVGVFQSKEAETERTDFETFGIFHNDLRENSWGYVD